MFHCKSSQKQKSQWEQWFIEKKNLEKNNDTSVALFFLIPAQCYGLECQCSSFHNFGAAGGHRHLNEFETVKGMFLDFITFSKTGHIPPDLPKMSVYIHLQIS